MTNRMERSKLNVAVIGDGGWGTALATVLNHNGHNTTVWGPFPEYIDSIILKNENTKFLPGVTLSPDISWTSDRKVAVNDKDLIVIAVPTKYFSDVLKSFRGLLPRQAKVLSVAKGLDSKTHKRMSQVAEEILQCTPVAALSGPSHAEEVARQIPTAVTIAIGDAQTARELQLAFANDRFRVYSSDDIIGTELGGAVKNVVAIAVGVSDGIGFGDNTKAALITRGLAELRRLGNAMGLKAFSIMKMEAASLATSSTSSPAS
jgi:glycerol-3-phosphate dehydrogenase (NAD(P)+)